MDDNSLKVIEVDINEILPNRFQPRIQFDEEKILELSDSIKEHGIIQPIVVRTIGDKYEIIAGERRYKASVLAGKETVPVIIKNLNDKDSAEIALIENIQRKNLTPIEEALSYKKILDMGYLTQENLATKLGKSQSSVANKIRLLNLSDEVQEALLDNKISERHARSLLRLKSTSDQNEMLNKIINERLTVRKTDEEIDRKNKEKGEITMNNEMNQNIIRQPGNIFDVFGGTNMSSSAQPEVPSMPALEPMTQVVEAPQVAAPTNVFGSMPQPEVPSMPALEPMPQVVEAPQVTAPTNVFGSMPQPEVPSMPTLEPMTQVAEAPQVAAPTNVFGSMPQPEVPSMPTLEPMTQVAEAPQVAAPTNVFGSVSQPEVPSMPALEPMTQVAEAPQVAEPTNMFGSMPQPEVPSMPALEPMTQVVEAPQVAAPTNVFGSMPQPEVPSMPIVEPVLPSVDQIQSNINSSSVFTVPNTSPIIEVPVINENVDNSDFNISNTTIQSPLSQEENIIPEPIIITDYSKQYDPIMPNTMIDSQSKVDFKEIVATIRECSSKIEKYGYKIEVEEYDLSTLYQVIFKIEK